MFSQDEINKMVFFDIETASRYGTLAELRRYDPKMADLWKDRCVYLKRRYVDSSTMSEDELYVEKAALHPEFAMVVCVCVGSIRKNNEPMVVSFYAEHGSTVNDEAELLRRMYVMFDRVFSSDHHARLCGHNIKRFDVPFLCKRSIINNVTIGLPLAGIRDMKPWDMPFVDTSELWSFGAWQESFASLDLLSHVLGLPSPKDEMHGSDVGRTYFAGDSTRIRRYCEGDVRATMDAVRRMSGITEGYSETSVADGMKIPM